MIEHLLEYQKYKEAAQQLKDRELLEKDIFTRIQGEEQRTGTDKDGVIIEVNLFDLVNALKNVIDRKDLSDHFTNF